MSTSKRYREMIAELISIAPAYGTGNPAINVITRARAMLAAPEAQTGSYQPTPVTPEDIDDRLRRAFRQAIADGISNEVPASTPVIAAPEVLVSDDAILRMAADALGYESIKPGEHESEGSAVDAYGSELLTFARAVLARYGTPAPVPVAERLPGVQDRNADGDCWWLTAADEETGAFWCLYEGGIGDHTHWLPHWALPLPATTAPGQS